MMRRSLVFAVIIFCGGFFTQTAFGCSCVTAESSEKDPKKIRESVRRFYLEEFKGALFTGTVTKVQEVKNRIDDNVYTIERKVTIEVERYWLGVKSPTVVVYTGIGGGDCGVNFEVGQKYFFNPNYIRGVLKSNICSYGSEEAKLADGKSFSDLNEIFGDAKTFKASKEN